MLKKLVILPIICGLLLLNHYAISQTVNGLWENVTEAEIPISGTRIIQPSEYETFRLNLNDVDTVLASAPTEIIGQIPESAVVLKLPNAEGEIVEFKIYYSPIMAEPLVSLFPEIRTYGGYSDDGSYVRLDRTPHGFHAMVRPFEGDVWFVDPYSFGTLNPEYYVIYNRKNHGRAVEEVLSCLTENDVILDRDDVFGENARYGDCQHREYRLALTATGEYTTFHGGTVALAQAAQVTTMNRVNGVFESELAVRMTIIGNNNLIIYTNAGTDPFTNGNPGAMINENQTVTDAVINAANYDIGHIFGTNSGGLAQLYSPCSGNKARGVTGSGAPIGDSFDVDYVAHEMGHQFGAQHTQNNNCNRSSSTSMEPGSAATIMGYAGICAPNVQSNSDDYFHAISLQEMGNFIITGGNGCATVTGLANGAPNVTSTPGNITVPASTPFALTATASDPNGDPLLYCWEQMDPTWSVVMPPVTTSTGGPNFRSFDPTPNPTRYFPNLTDLATGVAPTWEVLSSVGRTMPFRVSVRDYAVGGGCTDHEDITISIDGSTGPFLVTVPSNTGITWAGNNNETVSWSVAGTNGGAISCANVDIFLSTDGGATYPTQLANNVANDGSESIIVPNTASTTARIMVMCEDGTFFDISDNEFTITAATFDYTLATTSNSVSTCQPSDAVYSVNVGSIGGYSDLVSLSITGVPAGATAVFGTTTITPGNNTTLTISNTGSAIPGIYNITLQGNSTSGVKTESLTLTINAGTATATTSSTPANGANNMTIPTTLTWATSVSNPVTYTVDVATDAGFSSIIQTNSNILGTSLVLTGLATSTTYFWRVRVDNACSSSVYSPSFSFTTNNCETTASADVPVTISGSGTPTVTSDLVVTGAGTITSVTVSNFDISHTWINDLTITLTSPDGTTITLIDRICDGENDINVILDDGAALSITTAPCPPTGGVSYQPENALTAFIGEQASGTWTLTVTDNVNQDGGTINAWSLGICTSVVSCTNPTVPTLTFDNAPLCPGGTTNLNISGTLNDATSWEVYSTSCGTGTVGSTSGTTLSISPSGNTMYYVRGEGGCVNAGTCASEPLTVDDSVNPSISCPFNSDVNADENCQFALIDYTNSATVSDNCASTPTVSQSPSIGTLMTGVGTVQTVTLTANDGNGNTANCTFDLTGADVTGPTVDCSGITVINPSATCAMPDLTGSISVSDNCDLTPSISSQSPAPGADVSSLVGSSQTLTFVTTDATGNVTNCSVNVPVTDNLAPTISCPSNTTENTNGLCQFSLPDYTSSATIGNDCDGSPAVAQSPAASSIVTGVGTLQTVTLTVLDASGNNANCTFDVTLEDNSIPTISCPSNTTEDVNGSCQVSLPSYTTGATVSDNCDGSPSVTQSPTPTTVISGIGTVQTITLTATDANSNSAQCTFTVTTQDNTNPSITCPVNQTESADSNCDLSLPNYTGSATTDDNCDSSPTVTQSPTPTTVISGAGTTQTVTLTVTDASSNSASCTFDVTVEDNINPTITCPSDVVVTANGTICTANPPLGSPTVGDNCSVNSTLNDAPSSYTVGTATVTWTVTDGSTNTATCAQLVTVNTNLPSQPATITGTASFCSGDNETYSVTAVAGATSYTWSLPTGWTGISSTNSITVSTGANTGNISVTANNGCGSSPAQTLAVTLLSAPSQPATITGTTTPCSATSETYSITTVSGANSYNWTLPSGWAGTSTTTSITVTIGSGSGTVEVVAVGDCGNSPVQTLSVSPVALTAQPSAISGLSPACPNSSLSYSVTAVSGAVSYNWVLPSGWTGTSTTNSITASTTTTGGNLSVTAVNSCGQDGPSSTLNISVPTIDDGVPCTVDACNPANGNVTHTADDSYCDDSLWCNGQETCHVTNGCEAGTAPTIDDGNGCTDDSCDEVNDVIVNANNTAPCDDGDPFTANDQCVNGACVGTPLGNVWTGNINSIWGVAGNWSMYIPTSGLDGLIPTTPLGSNFPTIPSGFIADVDNLQVQANATINVQPGATLDVFGVLTNNGTINFDNNGSLLQRTGSTIAGNGTYNISRLGSGGFNYDYWSSPIINQPTVPGISYLYNSNTSTQDDADDMPSDPGWASYNGAMTQGQGYAARELGVYTFTGTVGNGPINKSLTYYAFDNTYSQTIAGTPFNLVGNPYPSAISASQFIADNPNIDGTIMFWDDDLSSGSGYHRSDYAYWNGTGGLGTGAGIIGAPNGFISTAQGFMVRALNSGSSISFNNNQRVPASNSQFFRMNGEDSRLWFSIERESSINQILIGMLDDATTSEDRLYDAVKMHTANSLSIAAIANDFEHAIMAFPPPTESQTVPLLVTANQAGYYLFKANILENFAGYQVFFNDVLSNTSELIEEGTTIERFLNPGEHANRFYLNFSLSTITSLSDYQTETLAAFVSQGTLHLSTNQTESFNSMIELIDARGRTVYSNKTQFFRYGKTIIPLPNLNTGMYLVKITSEQWVQSKRILLN